MSHNDYSFNARFKRVSPAQFAEKIGIPVGWIVVNHGHIPKRSARRKAHGAWFEVRSERGVAYRMLRFSPNLTMGTADAAGKMVIDWIGWIELHNRDEDVEDALVLSVRRVPWWKLPWAYLKHPDPAVRLSGWLGWVSICLGLLSLSLSLPYSVWAANLSLLYDYFQTLW